MTARTDNWLMAVLGIWMFITPWVFSDTAFFAGTGVATNFWIVGGSVVVLSLFALQKLQAWEEGINLILGIWMFLSPWVLGFSSSRPLLWNALISGVLVAALAGAALPEARRAEAV
ncbi:MAG: SPW repeat protein [Bdellovibrionaceae bacterium]|nr:SPW repeat protein [Pseudobdellovibrionaceae bacterium]